MLAKILSYALDGLTGYAVDVEVDINSGLPGYDMVGLASTATKESKERVRSAVKNSGFQYPAKRIIVNLAPADTKKEGPVFDLAVALGIMAATGQLENKAYKQYVIIGELSLNGELRHVNGIMPLLISAMQAGHRKFIIPASNAREASFIEGIEVYALETLRDVVEMLSGVHYDKVPSSTYESACVNHGYGVLFLDEMPEYSRRALETLRQPLEDRKVTVSRVQQTTEYPANFMLIASMNPCPCGNYGSKNQICRCTPAQIHNYVSKLSGPLMDRIDLQIEVDNISYDELRTKQSGESSAEIKKRINRVRALQRERFVNDGISTNAEMGSKELAKYCQIDENCERLLKKAFEKLNLSARGTTRILKVARTIADIEGCENILPAHIAEAIQYRGLDRKYS